MCLRCTGAGKLTTKSGTKLNISAGSTLLSTALLDSVKSVHAVTDPFTVKGPPEPVTNLPSVIYIPSSLVTPLPSVIFPPEIITTLPVFHVPTVIFPEIVTAPSTSNISFEFVIVPPVIDTGPCTHAQYAPEALVQPTGESPKFTEPITAGFTADRTRASIAA